MLKNNKVLKNSLFVLAIAGLVSGCETIDFESLFDTGYDDDYYYEEEYKETYTRETTVSPKNMTSSDRESYNQKMSGIKEVTPREVIDRMDAAGNYDLIGGYEPLSETEVQKSIIKWSDGNSSITLKDYKGHTIEIRKTIGGSELREMRVKFIQNQSGKPLSKRIVDILNEVTDAETISSCGMNSKPLIIYNKPSFEVKQATTFYKPEVIRSQYIREYAYRCLY